MILADSHCHLDDKQFDSDREQAIERALAAGVRYMVAIGTGEGPPDLSAGIRLADAHSCMYATVGIHPEHAAKASDRDFDAVRDLLHHPKVVAIGEIGLDYYWQPVAKAEQHRAFVRQLEIARAARKPIVLHTRDAWDDTFPILEQHWDAHDLPCVLHCFTGGPEVAERALALGCYLSFGGIVTYPKAAAVHASARLAPLDRMLLETDAPYLAPAPYRGKRNEPAYVAHTARRIAELRGVELFSVAEATTSNFRRAFAIP